MIDSLSIKNVALIKDLSVDFSDGFCVLIGETGAGKSIIIDALSFVLGGKGDKTMIRYGEEQMRVQASFSSFNGSIELVNILNDNGIEFNDELILSRTLSMSGKNDCRINGVIVPTATLKQCGSSLVNIFGQHENQLLLKERNHIGLIDEYALKDVSPLKEKLSTLIEKMSELNNQATSLGGSQEDRERRIDILNYQINEIELAKLQEGEEEEIKQEILKMSNCEKIENAINASLKSISSGSFFDEGLKTSIKELKQISSFDEKINNIVERLVASRIEIEDINETLTDIGQTIVFDSNRLAFLEDRQDTIKSIHKKYGATVNVVNDYLRNAKTEKDTLENSAQKLEEINKKKTSLKKEIFVVCKELSQVRRIASERIEKGVIKELSELGMKNTLFKVDFSADYDEEQIDKINFTQNGFDNVSFLFSANVGQELKSLSKTISGGEMSRFMLAIKNVLNEKENATTLVFDEVDSGVSGAIGVCVGQKIVNISRQHQVLCITHLPSVCSMADNIYFVSKRVENGETYSSIRKLQKEESIIEIAKMLSGKGESDISRKAAEELVLSSEEYKSNL